LGGSVPWAAFSAALVGWLLTLAVVKRAVDFFHLRSVRKPIVLFLSWLVAWALPFSLVHFDMWRVPGPFAATGGAAVVIAFIVLRFVLRLILSVRDRS
jgi:hypothetical protein